MLTYRQVWNELTAMIRWNAGMMTVFNMRECSKPAVQQIKLQVYENHKAIEQLRLLCVELWRKEKPNATRETQEEIPWTLSEILAAANGRGKLTIRTAP